jgi:hypothetical protein
VNGDPGAGDGSTGWTVAGDLHLDRPLPGGLVGVDHLHYPLRQPGGLVDLLDHPVTLRPVEVPHHLDFPGRVRAAGEHRPELHARTSWLKPVTSRSMT